MGVYITLRAGLSHLNPGGFGKQINHDLFVKPDLPFSQRQQNLHLTVSLWLVLKKVAGVVGSGRVDLVQNICDPKITRYFLAQILKL